MKQFRRLNTAVLALSIITTGCAINSKPESAMDVAIPDQFVFNASGNTVKSNTLSQSWWLVLNDAQLSALIDLALQKNHDVAIAQHRIHAARAAISYAQSDSLPQVNATMGSSREQLSGNGLFGSAITSGAFPQTYSSHQLGLDASWELDLFGANKAKTDSAQAAQDRAQAEKSAIQLRVSVEVARIYFEHAISEQQLEVVQSALELADQREALLQQQVNIGERQPDDVVQVRMQNEILRREVIQLMAQRDGLRFAMAELLGGSEPYALKASANTINLAIAQLREPLALATPSTVLRQRPDIRMADAQLRQAMAEHDFAVADQYPHFRLFGSWGADSLEVGDLLNAASEAWSLAAQVGTSLFDGGRKSALVDLREAQKEEAMSTYKKKITTALVDVETALLALQRSMKWLSSHESQLKDAHTILQREESRFRHGDCSRIELMNAQQQFESQKAETLTAQWLALRDWIRLQKSLGSTT